MRPNTTCDYEYINLLSFQFLDSLTTTVTIEYSSFPEGQGTIASSTSFELAYNPEFEAVSYPRAEPLIQCSAILHIHKRQELVTNRY